MSLLPMRATCPAQLILFNLPNGRLICNLKHTHIVLWRVYDLHTKSNEPM
jgi:hypothetical protein